MIIDPQQLAAATDEQLSVAVSTIEAEQNRRREMKDGPERIKVMTQRFIDYGGDPSKIPSAATYRRRAVTK